MTKDADARYLFGIAFVRAMPRNDDMSMPLPTSVDGSGSGKLIGGAGPFDFSDIDSSDDAVPLYSKIDNGAVETNLIDLSGVGAIAAVTASELRDAIQLAGVTNMTFTVDGTTGRITCTPSTGSYWQLYGECAEVAMFGQGLGIKFYKSDTIQSLTETPTQKEQEEFTETDAQGTDVEVLSDGYRKGFSGTMVDVADDMESLELLEGGIYDSDNEEYEVPTSEDNKIYFFIESYHYRFEKGTNLENAFVEYLQKRHRFCKSTPGEDTHNRGWTLKTFNLVGTAHKDNNILWGDTKKKILTTEEYDALHVATV